MLELHAMGSVSTLHLTQQSKLFDCFCAEQRLDGRQKRGTHNPGGFLGRMKFRVWSIWSSALVRGHTLVIDKTKESGTGITVVLPCDEPVLSIKTLP
jgi:hypothetical protein